MSGRQNSVKLEILNPRGCVSEIRELAMAPRTGTLDGKVVGLFWSGKAGGDILIARTGELLQERFKGVKLIKYFPGKLDVTKGADPSKLKEVAEKCDVVVNGQLD